MPSPRTTPAPAGSCPYGELQQAACWNEAGVYGNGSCPELSRLVHCRNCPVYSAAGAQLLNRPLPPGYRHEWTRHFTIEKKALEPAKTSGVIFRLRAEWLALPTQAFQEVAERRPIHSLPHRRRGLVLGLANVRGELLVCVSLGGLLALDPASLVPTPRSAYHRLLVVNWEGNRLAFPVDDVHGPHRFHLQELKAPPATLAKSRPAFTRGVFYWQERAVGLLDAELLFTTLNRSLM